MKNQGARKGQIISRSIWHRHSAAFTLYPDGVPHRAGPQRFQSRSERQLSGRPERLPATIGIILRDNPDRLVGADPAFITNARLPVRLSMEGYLETIPELVVEVRSKNDTWAEIHRKVAEYLAAGVHVIWVPDPEARTVTEFRPNQPERVYLEDDTLAIDDVIPGFRLAVRDALSA